MDNQAIENKVEEQVFSKVDAHLQETIDKEILFQLDYWLEVVSKKSKALSSSLRRCFNNARKSMRYVLVYKLGVEDKKNKKEIKEKLESYLENYLSDYFEKNDFMHYREFVRLLRACTIDVGGEASSNIKEMYNDFFFGKRLVKAYKLGREQEARGKRHEAGNMKNEA